jgi:hypothetical protein
VDRAELVERFASLPQRLVEAAEHTPPGPVPDGEWSPAEIVRHLIAVETTVWHARLDQLAAGGEPRWGWTEPRFDDGPEDRSLDELVETFSVRRAETVARLDGFGDEDWARRGIHDTYGPLDVEGLLRLAVDHDEEHVRGITASAG